MSTNHHVLCIDWGTTSFRASLVDTENEKVLISWRTDEGCKSIYQACTGVQSSPLAFFQEKLLQILIQKGIKITDYREIIISGMASSNIGMQSLPYAALPFPLDGAGLISQSFESTALGRLTLLSGVAASEDIMRGEETQLIGLVQSIDIANGMVIIPGTHSKHLEIQNGQLIDFKTYMTGELFQLIGEHSVLSNSIKKSQWSEAFESSFLNGVNAAADATLLHELFKIRSRDILGKSKGPEVAYFYLSGLIIGLELQALQDVKSRKIFACEDQMKILYGTALSCLSLSDVDFIDSTMLTNSYIDGQLTFLKNR